MTDNVFEQAFDTLFGVTVTPASPDDPRLGQRPPKIPAPKVYAPRSITRKRRTRVEMAELRDAIVSILSAERPLTLRSSTTASSAPTPS